MLTISVSLHCPFLLVTALNTTVSSQNVTTISVKQTFRTLYIAEREELIIFMFVPASMAIKTIYYPTDAQIYNSWIQLELL